MAYISLTRKSVTSAHEMTVCLTISDCKAIRSSIEKLELKARKRLERLIDIHESGEMTSKQQTSMVLAEEDFEAISSILAEIEELTKM